MRGSTRLGLLVTLATLATAGARKNEKCELVVGAGEVLGVGWMVGKLILWPRPSALQGDTPVHPRPRGQHWGHS